MEITFEDFCNRVNEDRKREIKEAVDRASEITEEMLEDILDILTIDIALERSNEELIRLALDCGLSVTETK